MTRPGTVGRWRRWWASGERRARLASAVSVSVAIPGGDGVLAGSLSPGSPAEQSAVVVLVQGPPGDGGLGDRASAALGSLASRLAAETGWNALGVDLRGTGASPGTLSGPGWCDDLRSVLRWAKGRGLVRVRLVGIGVAGPMVLEVAAQSPEVEGVALVGSPIDLRAWVADPGARWAALRRVGAVSGSLDADALSAWVDGFGRLRPLEAAASLRPRPLLVLHGAEDEETPPLDARAVADAASPSSELRLLSGAGHQIRDDPRTVALLIGWLERGGAASPGD